MFMFLIKFFLMCIFRWKNKLNLSILFSSKINFLFYIGLYQRYPGIRSQILWTWTYRRSWNALQKFHHVRALPFRYRLDPHKWWPSNITAYVFLCVRWAYHQISSASRAREDKKFDRYSRFWSEINTGRYLVPSLTLSSYTVQG